MFTDGNTFTKTGGTYGEVNVSWSFAFTAWKAGQPGLSSHGSQDCVRSDADGLWDDLGCSKELNYACQLAIFVYICVQIFSNQQYNFIEDITGYLRSIILLFFAIIYLGSTIAISKHVVLFGPVFLSRGFRRDMTSRGLGRARFSRHVLTIDTFF